MSVLVILALTAENGGSLEGASESSASAGAALASQTSGLSGSPLAAPEGDLAPYEGDGVASCVRLRLTGSAVGAAETIRLSLVAENQCEIAVAVLTSPVVVFDSSLAFTRRPWYGPRAIIAEFVLLPEGASLERAQQVRDAVLELRAPPDYFSVPPRSTAEIGVLAGDIKFRGLSPGRYCPVLLTYGAPLGDAEPRQHPLDLSHTLDQHNATAGAGRFQRHAAAQPLRCLCDYFEVR